MSERRMFGGLAFLVEGNMAVAASGQGGLMVRVDPAATERLLDAAGVHPMEMKGRSMAGWVRVDHAAIRTVRQLRRWTRIGVDRAQSLPTKSGPGATR